VHSRGEFDPDHRNHDRPLIARYAAGDAYVGEASDAEALIESCPECALLASDIRLLSTRQLELPPVRRPRDFRISADDAERLRGTWLDRLMRGIAAPGWAARPLAGAALTIGLALVAVGALPAPAQAPVGDAGALAPAATEAPEIFAAAPSAQPASEQAPADEASPRIAAPSEQISQPESGPTGSPGASTPLKEVLPPLPSAAAQGDLRPTIEVPPPIEAPPAEGDTQQLPEVTLGPGDQVDADNGAAGSEASPESGVSNITVQSTPAAAAAPEGPGETGLPQADAATPAATATNGAFLAGGLLLAAIGLAALLLIWYARRRYTDPLTR